MKAIDYVIAVTSRRAASAWNCSTRLLSVIWYDLSWRLMPPGTFRQRFEQAVKSMPQGICLYDAQDRLQLVNEQFCLIYNQPIDTLPIGIRFYDVLANSCAIGNYPGRSVEEIYAVRKAVIDGRRSATFVQELGDGRLISILHEPLDDGGWVCTYEDITERRLVEYERDRNYAFLREIIDHIPSLITVKDALTRQYLLVNRTAEAHFGVPREQVVGKTVFDVFSEQSARVVTADDEVLLSSQNSIVKDEHLWKTPTGTSLYVTSKRIGIRDASDNVRYIVNVIEDVSERRATSERISYLAHYDALTDLPNRVLFRSQIEQEWTRTMPSQPFALLYIDIDGFKGINDTLGHQIGDEFLTEIGRRLKSCLGGSDLIARLGGDEFAIARTDQCSPDALAEFIAALHGAIREPYRVRGHMLSSDCSIGVAIAPKDAADIEELIQHADLAMYAAKASGRRTYRFFEQKMTEDLRARLTLENDLRKALLDEQFEIYYQPVINLVSNDIVGCEALVRWRHPVRGMISPVEFIPVAEEIGLIVELGDWVLRKSCMEAATWPSEIRLAVNVSPVQLQSAGLAMAVTAALMAAGLAAHRLEIEITEAVLIRDDEAALSILHQLRAIGVKVALDDFGTGYSSLSYLRRFPFDKIKIDRGFVKDLENKGSSAIVQAVVSIAVACEMETTAEGVETPQQRALLRALGCTQMQGYLYSAPLAPDGLKELIRWPDGQSPCPRLVQN